MARNSAHGPIKSKAQTLLTSTGVYRPVSYMRINATMYAHTVLRSHTYIHAHPTFTQTHTYTLIHTHAYMH